MNLATIPTELKALPHWITWRIVERDGKPTKLPINPSFGRMADISDPGTWASFDEAMDDYYQRRRNGIGFVFSEHDPYVGVDFDHVRDDAGRIEDEALHTMKQLASYTEVSPSGTGFHVIARASRQFPGTRSGAVELYSTTRYFTITGRAVKAFRTIEERTPELTALWQSLGGQDVADMVAGDGAAPLSLTDKDVFNHACNLDTRFWGLYVMGDIGLCDHDHSRADYILVHTLAQVTRDAAQIDRLVRGSGLMREKWDERRGTLTYGARTIQRALARVG
jgi:primase-polymerase (primpol)-like protein